MSFDRLREACAILPVFYRTAIFLLCPANFSSINLGRLLSTPSSICRGRNVGGWVGCGAAFEGRVWEGEGDAVTGNVRRAGG